jgi:hypothetical protein
MLWKTRIWKTTIVESAHIIGVHQRRSPAVYTQGDSAIDLIDLSTRGNPTG